MASYALVEMYLDPVVIGFKALLLWPEREFMVLLASSKLVFPKRVEFGS